MIKSITVTNYLGDSLKLELTRPERSGFAVKSVTGLGPGKANINTSEMSTTDGGMVRSARLPARNIVLSLEFLRGSSIEDTRQKSYRYFPIKKPVTLLFETDNRIAEITGYVESNDPTVFSKSEGSDISIICPDPYFYSAGKDGIVSTVFYGVEPLFEFPFSNDGVTLSTTLEAPTIYLETLEDGETGTVPSPVATSSDITPLLEMSSIASAAERVISYGGDAEIGVTIRIHAIGEASNIAFTLRNASSAGSITIDTTKLKALTGSSIVAGDDIVISTMTGNKSVSLIRNGETTRILNCLGKDTNWFELTRGDNLIAYTADDGLENLNVVIENRVRYAGV